ncbi:MAG: aKG-HExxH-type peptide beta-hydroxylase [Phenylobacterium sp.]
MQNHRVPDSDRAYDRPWFPGLAENLVEPALAQRGLAAGRYGTRRWIETDPAAPGPAETPAPPLSVLEAPPPSLSAAYAAQGLRFAGPAGGGEKALLQDAWACLGRVPEAGTAVSHLVGAIHLLQSPGPGYDVSHSDPDLPCSVFLSLPVGEPHAVLRVAESILHEAMHLQLTLLEAVAPVVQVGTATLYSPWQQRQRPIGGLLHGLYVFAAIDAYLAELLALDDLAAATAAFSAKRRREIAVEIIQAAEVAEHEDLTPFGRRFAEGLLAALRRRQGPGGVSAGR